MAHEPLDINITPEWAREQAKLEDSNLQWTYDKQLETYLMGEPDKGCGVFIDVGKWYANVVHPSVTTIQCSLPLETYEAAVRWAEEEFARLETSDPDRS